MRVCVTICALLMAAGALADDAELVAALNSGGHIAMMRHSTAPGSDDPPNFRLGDCSTQRNLSEGGREQAVEIGEHLRANGLTEAAVVSSQWCRCVDTAELLGFGAVDELPSLNSIYSYPGQGRTMTEDLAAWIRARDLDRPTVLVTHQVNVSYLTGRGASEGEILVLQRAADGGLDYVGSILPD